MGNRGLYTYTNSTERLDVRIKRLNSIDYTRNSFGSPWGCPDSAEECTKYLLLFGSIRWIASVIVSTAQALRRLNAESATYKEMSSGFPSKKSGMKTWY